MGWNPVTLGTKAQRDCPTFLITLEDPETGVEKNQSRIALRTAALLVMTMLLESTLQSVERIHSSIITAELHTSPINAIKRETLGAVSRW